MSSLAKWRYKSRRMGWPERLGRSLAYARLRSRNPMKSQTGILTLAQAGTNKRPRTNGYSAAATAMSPPLFPRAFNNNSALPAGSSVGGSSNDVAKGRTVYAKKRRLSYAAKQALKMNYPREFRERTAEPLTCLANVQQPSNWWCFKKSLIDNLIAKDVDLSVNTAVAQSTKVWVTRSYTTFNIANNTTATCKLKALIFRCVDNTNDEVGTLWASDIVNRGITTATDYTKRIGTVPIGDYEGLRNFWKFQKMETFTIGAGGQLRLKYKGPMRGLYTKQELTFTTDYRKRQSMMVYFILCGQVANDSTTATSVGYSPASLNIVQEEVVQYKVVPGDTARLYLQTGTPELLGNATKFVNVEEDTVSTYATS